jgi:hypothetical protein
MDFDLRLRTIARETDRLERALQSCDAALTELRARGDVTGLERLRDDLRTALLLAERAEGSGGGRGPRRAAA